MMIEYLMTILFDVELEVEKSSSPHEETSPPSDKGYLAVCFMRTFMSIEP